MKKGVFKIYKNSIYASEDIKKFIKLNPKPYMLVDKDDRINLAENWETLITHCGEKTVKEIKQVIAL